MKVIERSLNQRAPLTRGGSTPSLRIFGSDLRDAPAAHLQPASASGAVLPSGPPKATELSRPALQGRHNYRYLAQAATLSALVLAAGLTPLLSGGSVAHAAQSSQSLLVTPDRAAPLPAVDVAPTPPKKGAGHRHTPPAVLEPPVSPTAPSTTSPPAAAAPPPPDKKPDAKTAGDPPAANGNGTGSGNYDIVLWNGYQAFQAPDKHLTVTLGETTLSPVQSSGSQGMLVAGGALFATRLADVAFTDKQTLSTGATIQEQWDGNLAGVDLLTGSVGQGGHGATLSSTPALTANTSGSLTVRQPLLGGTLQFGLNGADTESLLTGQNGGTLKGTQGYNYQTKVPAPGGTLHFTGQVQAQETYQFGSLPQGLVMGANPGGQDDTGLGLNGNQMQAAPMFLSDPSGRILNFNSSPISPPSTAPAKPAPPLKAKVQATASVSHQSTVGGGTLTVGGQIGASRDLVKRTDTLGAGAVVDYQHPLTSSLSLDLQARATILHPLETGPNQVAATLQEGLKYDKWTFDTSQTANVHGKPTFGVGVQYQVSDHATIGVSVTTNGTVGTNLTFRW